MTEVVKEEFFTFMQPGEISDRFLGILMEKLSPFPFAGGRGGKIRVKGERDKE